MDTADLEHAIAKLTDAELISFECHMGHFTRAMLAQDERRVTWDQQLHRDGRLPNGRPRRTGARHPRVVGVQLQQARTWLRCRATRVGTTDTHTVSVVVLAVPSGL